MEIILIAILFIGLILFFIFIISIRVSRRTPEYKGQKGEERVIQVLGENIPNTKYVINNLTIVSNGKSSQIDHLVITQVGIFVIETKNYSGIIYGREDQEYWTQVLSYGRVKHRHYNPILQNSTHIYRLRQVLVQLAKNDCFISVIVFPKAKLMTGPIPNVGDIENLIRIYTMPRQVIFSVDEINEIYNKLLALKNNPQISNDEHIQGIWKRQQNIAYNICLRCGKALVVRNGQYSLFYGCSGYPNCKFKKRL